MARTTKKPSAIEHLFAASEQLRLTAANPNLNRYKPHPKQEMFCAEPKKHRLYIGGNRSGKTVAGVIEDIYYLRGEHPHRKIPEGPIRGRVVGVDFASGIDKILLPQFQQWVPKSLLINGSWDDSYSKERRVLTLENGSFVEFMSYDQDLQKFAGTSRHFVHFDEEPPEPVYEECRARLVDTNGDWWMTLTPVEGMEYIYEEVYIPGKEGHPQFGVIEVEMSENPYLDPRAIEDYLSSLSDDQRAIREKGQFIQVGGAVFKSFNQMSHTIPPEEFKLTKRHRIYVSVDYGWRDPTAILWHAVAPDGQITTFAEHYQSQMTIAEHVQAFHRINEEWGVEPYMTVGDPALAQTNGVKGTSYQQEFNLHGMNIVIDIIPRKIGIGLNKMQQYMKVNPNTNKPFWQMTDNCPNLISELSKLKYKRRANRQQEMSLNKLEEIQDKNNHAFDSSRYFFTLMDDLTPDTIKSLKERFMDFDDTPAIAQFDNRRDPGFSGWKFNTSSEDAVGWE
jgi:phage terminase large subunit-like protein